MKQFCLSIGLLLLACTPAFAQPFLMGYFPQWGLYQDPPYTVHSLVASGAAGLLSQIDYAQGSVTGGRCGIADANADLNFSFPAQQSVNGVADQPSQPLRGDFHQLQELKQRYPDLRILISLEGRAESFEQAALPQSREAFVASCIDTFLRGHFASGIHAPGLFDGIDLDWEFPRKEDSGNFIALLAEFRRQLNALDPTLLLTIAAGPSPGMYHDVDMGAASTYLDEIGLMNYDYNGPWRHETGFIAPLYTPDNDPEPHHDVDSTVHAYLSAGVPAHKLLLGLPFYGYGWQSVPPADHGLFQPGKAIHADRPWSYLRQLEDTSALYRDPRSQAPWLYDGHTFWTFEDPVSVTFKARYATDHRLLGMMIWELSNDSQNADLLKSLAGKVHAPPEKTGSQ
ncbi:MAG: glycoside hydrolase family 18 protein [Acidobacteria bacterium]|nr:glycoside hydrolase family 18 protein [Acidobacteriota bacterium]